jgi:hypothetical protein
MRSAAAEKRHVIGWIALPFLAVLNGFVRDTTYGPSLGYGLSHAVSVLPLLLLIALWAGFLARRWPLPGVAVGWRVGLVWLSLTLAFEFGLGALQGVALEAMLADYDVTRGQLWPLVPLATLVIPPIMARKETVAA